MLQHLEISVTYSGNFHKILSKTFDKYVKYLFQIKFLEISDTMSLNIWQTLTIFVCILLYMFGKCLYVRET